MGNRGFKLVILLQILLLGVQIKRSHSISHETHSLDDSPANEIVEKTTANQNAWSNETETFETKVSDFSGPKLDEEDKEKEVLSNEVSVTGGKDKVLSKIHDDIATDEPSSLSATNFGEKEVAKKKKGKKIKKKRGKKNKTREKAKAEKSKLVENEMQNDVFVTNATDLIGLDWLPQPYSKFPDFYAKKKYGKQLNDILQNKGDYLQADSTTFPRYDTRSPEWSHFLSLKRDLGEYLNTCADCMDHSENYYCSMHGSAQEMKERTVELQELISYGCKTPGLCCSAVGKCCLQDKTFFRSVIKKVTTLVTEIKDMFVQECAKCSVDCGWSSWSEWTLCDVTCGAGTRMRRRKRDNPPRKGGGRDCDGDEIQTEQCCNPPCCTPVDCQWGPWQSWTICSATCGSGTRTRYRSVARPANECGRDCFGPSEETADCTSQISAVDCQWGPWQPWSQCSVTCGTGTRSRYRTVAQFNNECGLDCLGSPDETVVCEARDCCGPWGTWSECTQSCGMGDITRYRFCGTESQTESRTIRCGPDIGRPEWSAWSRWSACNGQCGYGNQTRERYCRRNACDVGNCYGDTSETKSCYQQCEYTWGSWSGNADLCNCCSEGVQTRRRKCLKKLPSGSYKEDQKYHCPGPSEQDVPCNPVDFCPPCISSCYNMRDGRYPSCISCSHFVECNRDIGTVVKCAENYQWSAFTKECVDPPSSSCQLQLPVDNCRGFRGTTSHHYKADPSQISDSHCRQYINCTDGTITGIYNCDPNEEFHALLKRCIAAPSPTCMRRPTNLNMKYSSFLAPPPTTAPQAPQGPRNDLPWHALDRHNEEDRRQTEEEITREGEKKRRTDEEMRKRAYDEERRRKSELGRGANGERKETPSFENYEQSHTNGAQRFQLINPDCIQSCDRVPPGIYASCKGCRFYIGCSGGKKVYENPCSNSLQFDSNKKVCIKRSKTCIRVDETDGEKMVISEKVEIGLNGQQIVVGRDEKEEIVEEKEKLENGQMVTEVVEEEENLDEIGKDDEKEESSVIAETNKEKIDNGEVGDVEEEEREKEEIERVANETSLVKTDTEAENGEEKEMNGEINELEENDEKKEIETDLEEIEQRGEGKEERENGLEGVAEEEKEPEVEMEDAKVTVEPDDVDNKEVVGEEGGQEAGEEKGEKEGIDEHEVEEGKRKKKKKKKGKKQGEKEVTEQNGLEEEENGRNDTINGWDEEESEWNDTINGWDEEESGWNDTINGWDDEDNGLNGEDNKLEERDQEEKGEDVEENEEAIVEENVEAEKKGGGWFWT